jgi:hypothetical protein
MSWTLESGACLQCQAENSIHINDCHSCGAALPWTGAESTKVEEKYRPKEPVIIRIPEWLRWTTFTVGAVLFLGGAFLWCGNVFGFYPTIPGAGRVTMLIGGALFVLGNTGTFKES